MLDVFCLFYDAASQTVKGVNGSGRSPKALTLEYLRSQGITGDAVSLISYLFIRTDPSLLIDSLDEPERRHSPRCGSRMA